MNAWLINYLLHSSALLGVAWLAEACGVLVEPRLREFAWRLALAGALVTASVVTWLPGLPLLQVPTLSIAALQAPETAEPAPPARVAPKISAPAPNVVSTAHPASAVPATPRGLPSISPAAPVLAWLVVSTLLLLRLLRAALHAQAELREREPLHDGLAIARARALCAQRKLTPKLSVVDELPGPVTLPNGEICLPRWAIERLDTRQLDAMLAHELAHVERHDALWLLGALAINAILFFQPLNWLAHRRLATLAELNADARATQLTGDRRALAEVLATCARHVQERVASPHAFLLGIAMTDRRSPLVQRVDRLLKGINMQTTIISRPVRVIGFAMLLGAVLLLPALAPAGNENRTHVTTARGNGEMTFETSRGHYRLRVKAKGEVHFTADEHDVASVEDEFSILERQAGSEQEIHYENVDGKLERVYSRDGDEMPLDATGKAWLADVILRVLRNSALDAEARVARFLEKGGVDAVLEEMRKIESGHALATYAALLADGHALEGEEIAQLLDLLEKLESDFELRQALSNIATSQSLDPPRQQRALELARAIDSDFETAELLALLTPQLDTSDATLAAWSATASRIGSDFELRRALMPVFSREMPKTWYAQTLDIAANRISSDFELRSLLEAAAPRIVALPQMVDSYLDAVAEIGSDFETRSALVALVETNALDAAGYSRVLGASNGIGSDFEALQVLLAAAPRMPQEEALLQKYRAIANGLGDHAQRQAERALEH